MFFQVFIFFFFLFELMVQVFWFANVFQLFFLLWKFHSQGNPFILKLLIFAINSRLPLRKMNDVVEYTYFLFQFDNFFFWLTHQSLHQFHATGLFLYPFKLSENQRFFDVFRGYISKPVARNQLIEHCMK